MLARIYSVKIGVIVRVRFERWKVDKQESPAITDKPARRKSMPKIAPIRRDYNVVAD